MRRTLMLLALSAAIAGPAVAAVRVAIPVTHSARLQIPGLAGSVVVGDPAVADALVIDPHTIYVQGKAYGQTEIVVLDREGRTVWQGDVAVITPNEGRVTIVRGASGNGQDTPGTPTGSGKASGMPSITEMTCADVCSPVAPAPNAKKD
jgi:hypothetical protein